MIIQSFTPNICREELGEIHLSVPRLMSTWQLELALAAAERKLVLLRSISCQMVTVIPSALLELYEINRIALARARGHSRRQELKYLAEEALQRSAQMGDSFVKTFHQKMSQIEEECKSMKTLK